MLYNKQQLLQRLFRISLVALNTDINQLEQHKIFKENISHLCGKYYILIITVPAII